MKYKEIIGYVMIILIVILIRTFVVTPIRVNGDSMNDTLENGNLMILKKYKKNDIHRFDIVVVKAEDEKIIKRVIGLPKEDVEYKDDTLYINGKVIKDNYGKESTENFKDYCSEDEYFVMGDNRNNSLDSRRIGCVNKKQIMGTTNFVFFPFSKIGKVK